MIIQGEWPVYELPPDIDYEAHHREYDTRLRETVARLATADTDNRIVPPTRPDTDRSPS